MKPKFSEEPKEWRKNALLSALGLAVMSSVLRWRRVLPVTVWTVILGALATIAVAAVGNPRLFRGFHRFSIRIGFGISQLAGLIVLSFFFVVIVTPLAVLSRLIGKDPLRLKRSSAESYWVNSPPKTPVDRMF